ncbi:MAG TPA: hypothetical protein VGG64_28780 [Pirellulales bacterium]|jgi:hypothetical protein
MIRGCLVTFGVVCLLSPVAYAAVPGKPNVLVILADNKYECARPDMDKCR